MRGAGVGRLQAPFAAASLAFRPPPRRGVDAAARLPTGCQRFHLGAHHLVDAWRRGTPRPRGRPRAHASGAVAAATAVRGDGVPDPTRADAGALPRGVGSSTRPRVGTDDVTSMSSTSSSTETRKTENKTAPLDEPEPPPRPGAVMWFRQDLRLHDNQAFHAAVKAAKKTGGSVLCVFIWSEEEEGDDDASWRPGDASRVWLGHALDALDRDLRMRYGGGGDGGGLTYMRGTHADALRVALDACDASVVFASERFEPAQVSNDAKTNATLSESNASLRLMPGHLLFDPRATKIDMANEKYFFGTLMPYVHAAEKTNPKPGAPKPAPPSAPLAGADGNAGAAARLRARLEDECARNGHDVFLAPDVDALGVFPPSDAAVDWSSGIRAAWDISEAGAEEAWAHFKRLNLARYEEDASLTDDDATAVSRLSPYLRFGQISPRRLYREMSVAEKKTKTKDGVFDSINVPGRQLSRTFWHRLYRREFAYWQLTHWPTLATRSVRAHYERRADWRLAWTEADEAKGAIDHVSVRDTKKNASIDSIESESEEDAFGAASGSPDIPARVAFERWRLGETGFPAVDVGMRRLWRTGWMHQTERMIAATFLTDYLGVDWRHGARWFHDTLVDADLAINAMMWQNAGKSGLDQWDVFAGALLPDGSSRGHDPRGDAIARFIPELRRLPPGHWRHRPWEAPDRVLLESGVALSSEWRASRHTKEKEKEKTEENAVRMTTNTHGFATYPSRITPFIERHRARAVAGVDAVRVAQLERAVERMEAIAEETGVNSPSADAGFGAARGTDVLVDPRTGADYVVVPEGATMAHDGSLLPVSTRKEFKKALKEARGVLGVSDEDAEGSAMARDADPPTSEGFPRRTPKRLPKRSKKSPPGVFSRTTGAFFALADIADWAAAHLNVRATGAAIDRRTGAAAPSDDETGFARACDVGKKRSARAERDGTAHSHSHAHGGVTHSHSHGGHSHLPGDAIGKNHIGHTHGGGGGGGKSAKSAKSASKKAPSRGKGLKSSSWAAGRGSGAARGAAAKEAERRAVKASRREARELAAWSSGMRVGDVGGEKEDDGY